MTLDRGNISEFYKTEVAILEEFLGGPLPDSLLDTLPKAFFQACLALEKASEDLSSAQIESFLDLSRCPKYVKDPQFGEEIMSCLSKVETVYQLFASIGITDTKRIKRLIEWTARSIRNPYCEYAEMPDELSRTEIPASSNLARIYLRVRYAALQATTNARSSLYEHAKLGLGGQLATMPQQVGRDAAKSALQTEVGFKPKKNSQNSRGHGIEVAM